MCSRLLPLKLALHEVRHGWRHFVVFIACLVLGITVINTVNSLGAAVKQGLAAEAQSLLGGDVEVSVSNANLNDEQKAFIEKYGATSHIVTLRGMAQSSDVPTLVEIKAIDDAYPLLGNLKLSEGVNRAEVFTENGIAAEETLLTQLNVKLGDEILIGMEKFRINAIILNEPDKVVHIFSFGPRVMLSHAALKRSGLISPLSLLTNSYRIKLDDIKNVEAIQSEFKKLYPDSLVRFKTGTDGNQAVANFIQQLISFLALSGLATFLIGGLGIGSAVRAYMEKKAGSIAIMKTLGASQSSVFKLYIIVLAILGVVGSVLGILLSTLVSVAVMPFLSSWLPSISKTVFYPVISVLSLWYGLLIVFIFSMPSLLGALATRPAALFRSHIGHVQIVNEKTLWIIETILVSVLVFTLFITAGDRVFIIGAIVVVFFTFCVFWQLSYFLKLYARKANVKRLWLKIALNNLYRVGSTTGTVILIVGLSLTLLIALTLTEANFQKRITTVVEEKAPSLFMIDIQPHQKEGVEALLKSHAGDKGLMIYPMVRGRITHLNGKEVNELEVDQDVRWAIRGDRGLSYSAQPPENSNIIEGAWWPQDYSGKPLVSVDVRFLKGMNLKLGDTITLNILGNEVEAEVSSARKIDYTTFQINFAMMLSPGAIDNFPQTFLATVFLEHGVEEETALVKQIARDFPGVTIIRTGETVKLVKDVVRHISTALSITVMVSIITGLLVLTAALVAMMEQRLYDTAVLKVLGARRSEVLKIYTSEWLIVGAVASLFSIFIGTLCSWLILRRLRGEGFYLMPEVTITTMVISLVVIWLIAYFGNRQVFSIRPMNLLRNE
jgi:putative ABC transport system permease protein